MEETAPISFFPRTEGDGMEAMETPITSDLKSVINTTSLALRDLNVSSPSGNPPASAPERVISLNPKAANIPGPTSNKGKPTPNSLDKNKAKFVPYEPYKAAVKPIIPLRKKVLNARSPEGVHQHPSPSSGSKAIKERERTASASLSNAVPQEDYDKLLKEKEELEKELKINSKVNAELKRLLVASVGEDMEARVHFLTEDKVKLGDDIRQYVEKIATDFEQKEKLSIEADIWRSKFLASSVVIEELTKWKSVLCHRNDDLQLCVKGLLDEMQLMQKNFKQTFAHLKALNKAFDPLGNSGRQTPETTQSDVVEMSASILQSAESLSKRLLGTYTQVRDGGDVLPNSSGTVTEKLSPAQLAANEVLTSHPAGACSMTEMMSDVTAQHVAALARRSMNKTTFSCCPHCTGQVHVV